MAFNICPFGQVLDRHYDPHQMVKHNSAIKFCPGFNGSDDVSVGNVQPLATIHAAISSRQPGSSLGAM